jgi:hypothetical protein
MLIQDFNKHYYIVYNVVTHTELEARPSDISKIIELYSLLINSPHVVTVEQFGSTDGLKHEFRVIFWNHESYLNWASENIEKYQELIYVFEESFNTDVSKFDRYASSDGYVSEFPYTYYPPKNNLLDWVLIPYHAEYFIKNILPLGHMKIYNGEGLFEKPPAMLTGCRFLKDRTSDIVRLSNSANSSKYRNYPTALMAYTFDHILSTMMYDTPWLYRKLTKLTTDIEKHAETYIKECEHSAVLIGHNSFGSKLTLHTHRLTDTPKYTVTITVRLTFTDENATLTTYSPIGDDDPNLPYYYTNPALLVNNTRHKTKNNIVMDARSSLLVFNASYIPHLVTYTNDIYLFYVYDNVTFKPGILEQIQSTSTYKHYTDHKGKELYFSDLPLFR